LSWGEHHSDRDPVLMLNVDSDCIAGRSANLRREGERPEMNDALSKPGNGWETKALKGLPAPTETAHFAYDARPA
jgi:hypothetical protein